MKRVTIQIDRAGRVVLPKAVRERFRLRGGDTMAIEVRDDAIELRPTQAAGQLKRVNGVLIFAGTAPLESGRDFVAESREQRIQELSRDVKRQR